MIAPSHSTPNANRNFNDDERRWQALLRRDCNADGRFVFAVQTTGVYCRPSCAARRAKRENVRFFTSCTQAQRAGFRPCKRCRPNEDSLSQRQQQAVARACRLIEQADDPPKLADLAEKVGLSRYHFQRVFKRLTGVTPKAYAAAQRAHRVRNQLIQGAAVTQAIYDAGFNSSGRFYESAAAQLGMSPQAYRAGGAGTTIRFAVGECSLGSVLVAASEKGVCAILLGEDPDALVRDLQDRFPRARLLPGEATFDRSVAQVVALVERPSLGLDLPLDIRGTTFQVRVWQALRAIPPGSTTTYGEIAGQIGQPTAARAVGSAIAANPLAVIVPCHRVIRTDASLSGYRWGVERKAELQQRERAASASQTPNSFVSGENLDR